MKQPELSIPDEEELKETVETQKKYVREDVETEMEQYFGSNVIMSFVKALGGLTAGAAVMFCFNILYIYFPFITDAYENWLPVFNLLLISYVVIFMAQQFIKRELLRNGLDVLRWLLIFIAVFSFNATFPFDVHPWIIIIFRVLLIASMALLVYLVSKSVYKAVRPVLPDLLGKAEKFVLSVAEGVDSKSAENDGYDDEDEES